MRIKVNQELLNQVMKEIDSKKDIFSTVLCVESGDKSFSWIGSSGEMQKDSQYFIASVTKLYITSVVMRLVEERRLELWDPISKYLSKDILQGLHILKGVDYSQHITIKHLISNTSGIPDYFFHKQSSGETSSLKILEGEDVSWRFEETISYVKGLTPKFSPGEKRRAAYSDTNYQLLGRIIENITEKSIEEVFKEYIFDVLNLNKSYGYKDISDTNPTPFYYNSKKLWVPNYIASVTAEGGIVSTAEESMIFIKSFFQEKLFPKENIESLKEWRLILPPPSLFFYGVGLEKLFVPRIVSPFKPITEILGFWGQTGSFAWYNPDTDLYFTGTTNQINGKGHSAIVKAMLKIIKSAL